MKKKTEAKLGLYLVTPERKPGKPILLDSETHLQGRVRRC